MWETGKHSRRSIRLIGYDYSLAGMYFVTIVTQSKLCLFGHVKNDEMFVNDAGDMITHAWLDMQIGFHTFFATCSL